MNNVMLMQRTMTVKFSTLEDNVQKVASCFLHSIVPRKFLMELCSTANHTSKYITIIVCCP